MNGSAENLAGKQLNLFEAFAPKMCLLYVYNVYIRIRMGILLTFDRKTIMTL